MENNNNKNKTIKKTRFLKIIIFTSIVIGLVLILYPVYTNFIAGGRESTVLSAWEDQKEEYFEEIDSAEVNSDGGDSGQTSQGESETINGSGENNEVTMEIKGDTTVEATLDYSDLTLEDFFPLKILIPKIEVEAIVEEGTDPQSLKNGPGYEALTPLPGDEGRCTISGHRTTYGAPFNRLDELENGDLIYLETVNDELLTYMVTGIEIVRATDVWILEGTGKKELVLTTCHPKYSAARRLVIIAEKLEIFSFDFGKEA